MSDDAVGRLAALLQPYAWRDDALVVALTGAGSDLARHIAHHLGLPLRQVAVHPLRHHGIAFGAVSDVGPQVIEERLARMLGLGPVQVGVIASREMAQIRRELAEAGADAAPLAGKHLLLVVDRVPERAMARYAALALRGAKPLDLVLAAPLVPPEDLPRLDTAFDRIVSLNAIAGAEATDDARFGQPVPAG